MHESDRAHVTIKRYLLNDLNEGERQEVEERYFSSADFLAEVETVEDELVEDYVHELLSPEDNERFIRHLLPAQRYAQKVRLARDLMSYTASRRLASQAVVPPGSARRRLLIGITFGLLLLAAVGIGFRLWTRHATPEREAPPQIISITPEHTPGTATANATSTPTTQSASSPVVATLLPTQIRGDRQATQQVEVPQGGAALLLRLALPPSTARSFQAVVRDDRGAEVISLQDLRRPVADGNSSVESSVPVNVPAGALSRGDYQISLRRESDGEEVATYYLRVVER